MSQYKHKGIQMWFDESRDIWYADVNGERIENKQYGNLKATIDRVLKGDFERVEAYYGGRWGGEKYERVYITSFDGRYCWIIDAKKKRQKVSPSHLYEATAKNKAIFDEIRALEKEADTIHKKIEKVSAGLTTIDEDQFKKKIDKAA